MAKTRYTAVSAFARKKWRRDPVKSIGQVKSGVTEARRRPQTVTLNP